jgi:hypothetical protein
LETTLKREEVVLGGSLRTLEQVRMYSVSVSDPRVGELITWYLKALQRAVDIIWESVEWRYAFPRVERRGGKLKVATPYKVKVPELPRSSAFKKRLRDGLLKECPYAKHWVDSVIRTAYSIMGSWRKRYLKGRARRARPRVRGYIPPIGSSTPGRVSGPLPLPLSLQGTRGYGCYHSPGGIGLTLCMLEVGLRGSHALQSSSRILGGAEIINPHPHPKGRGFQL